ncbi:MAG: AMP-binding protein [Verrucomicrobiales bacterium]|nr:AMP-binding protein [Verrucomicrobiales bacterium]
MSDRAAIETLQLGRLRALVAELRRGNAFYRERLADAGIDEKNLASLADFSARMPFTSKMDLVWDREEYPPYGSNLTYPLARYSRYCQSSGTTSSPLPWLDTPESWSAMLDCWDRVYDAAGVTPDDAIFFAFSFGPFLGFWTAFDAATRRGNLAIPSGGLSSEARLQVILTNRASVLCCTPTYALRLGEVLATLDPADTADLAVRTIIVAGEPGGSIPEVRGRISSLWRGARICDHHGMTEVGPVTYETPGRPLHLCVIEEAYYAEILDRDTEQEVAPGERGELVITTLTRTASPLLRYRTGDLVQKAWTEDPAGHPVLTLDGGILGRVDEMIVIRGVNIYPTAVEKIIRGFPEVAEFQVTQTTHHHMAELEIAVEPHTTPPPHVNLEKRLAQALTNAFALRIPVRLVAPGSLPRYEFKSRRWVKRDA